MRIGQLKELVGTRLSLPSTKVIRALLLSLFATSSLAQTPTTGAIFGRVMNTDGVAVPNVTLIVTSEHLIGGLSATSGKDGVFRIKNIPPGKYRVSVSLNRGFITAEGHVVDVNISKTSSFFVLVHGRRENRSTTLGRQSHKPSPAQTNTNSQGSIPSTISFSSPKAPGKPKSTLQSHGNEPEAAIKIDPKIGNPSAKLNETYAGLRAEDKSVGDGRAASEARVGMSSLSVPASVDAISGPETNAIDPRQIYRVGIGDVLDVWLSTARSDKSTLFTVSASGVLEHPILAHPLIVAGLTTEEISDRIKAELKRLKLDENTEVLIGVREYVSHAILVSGLVKDPGMKILRREAIPLYVVLADAQPMPEAGRATIVSKEMSVPTIVELSDPKALSLVVRPGDVINVQATPEQFLYIGGDVKAPGEKRFRRGLTLTQAILAAGGLSRKSKEVQIARESTNGRLVAARYKLEDINSGRLPDPLIQPGDRITVVR